MAFALPLVTGLGSFLTGGSAVATGAGSLATGMEGAGALLSTYGSYSGAQAQNRAARYNAQTALNNAQSTEQESAQQQTKIAEQTAQQVGKQTAAYGSSGVDPSSGTAAVVEQQTKDLGKQDIITTRYNYQRQDNAFQDEAQAAYKSQVSPILAAASTGIQGYGKFLSSQRYDKQYLDYMNMLNPGGNRMAPPVP